MIDIKTLNPIVQAKLKHAPLMYVATNGKEVDIRHLSAIVLEKDPTHVVQVLDKQKYEGSEFPFYLQHIDLFHQAQVLYLSMFGQEPDSKIYEYQDNYSVSLFLFFNLELVKRSLRQEEIKIRIRIGSLNKKESYFKKQLEKEERLGINVENIKIENGFLELKLPIGVYPVLGACNSVNSGFRTPNFNLIFGTEYSNKFDESRYQYNPPKDISIEPNAPMIKNNIDVELEKLFPDGLSLYSIDKYDFKKDPNVTRHYNPDDNEKFYEESLKMAKDSFVDTTVSFLLAINRSRYLDINEEQFSAFMPHFYRFDRTVESVDTLDSKEKNQYRKLYDNSHKFAFLRKPNLTCKNFIDYFLRDSIINFEALKKDPAKEILKAFKEQPQIPLLINKKKEIFSRFITNGKPNNNYEKFINGQVEAKRKIDPLL
jgi:hypothetical protein